MQKALENQTVTPAQDCYLSVDDLVRAAHGLVRRHSGFSVLRQVGSSQAGEPLWLLSVGARTSPDVLLIGGPHANEPLGGATIARLAESVCQQPALRALATWHFLLCLDPDGARLNEGWLRQPGDLAAQLRSYYRPAGSRQPEWLPADPSTPPLPETRALLDVLDEIRPLVQFSLHSNDVGGTWIQLTQDVPGVAEAQAHSAARLGIPLGVGPVDTLHMPSPQPGLFLMPLADQLSTQVVDYEDTVRSTWFRAARQGTVTALLDTPVWAVPAAADATPVDNCPQIVRAAVAVLRERIQRLISWRDAAQLEPPATGAPLTEAALWFVEACDRNADKWEELSPRQGSAPRLTAANALALRMSAQRLSLRATATLARALAEEQGVQAADHRLLQAIQTQFTAWLHQFATEFAPQWIPVHRQVALQVEVILSLTQLLTSTRTV